MSKNRVYVKRLLSVGFIMLFFGSTAICNAGQPTQAFVNELLKNPLAELWYVDPRKVGQAPLGGYILRCDLPLDNRGTTITFLSLALPDMGDKLLWTGYSGKTKAQSKEVFPEHYIAVPNLFERPTEKGTVFASYSVSKYGDSLTTFGLVGGRFKMSDGKIPAYSFRDTNDQFSDTEFGKATDFRRIPCPIRKMLLAKFLKSGREDWKPINSHYSLDQQYFDESDKADIKALVSWKHP